MIETTNRNKIKLTDRVDQEAFVHQDKQQMLPPVCYLQPVTGSLKNKVSQNTLNK